MKLLKIISLILGIILFVSLISAMASVPAELNYQGHIEDTNGPVDGSIGLIFRLYDVFEYGTPVWEETHSAIVVDQGIYNVILGTGTINNSYGTLKISLFDYEHLWLEVQVVDDSEAMSPRQKITSVGTAIRSGYADNAGQLNGQESSSYDQSAHLPRTDNPHSVTAAQTGAVSSAEYNSHTSSSGVHHVKTTSFTELTDIAVEAQIPPEITRDSELTWSNLSGIPVGFADSTDDDSGGDITSVVAGTGLEGGAGSGDATVQITVPLELSAISISPIIKGLNNGNGAGVMGEQPLSQSVGYLGGSNIGVYGSAIGIDSYAGYFNGNIRAESNNGRLALRTPTHNDPGRYSIQFDNNALGLFIGDDTEDQYFNFYTDFVKSRTYDAHLKVFGKAADSWGSYVELTHDGTDGVLRTDKGDILINPSGDAIISGNLKTSNDFQYTTEKIFNLGVPACAFQKNEDFNLNYGAEWCNSSSGSYGYICDDAPGYPSVYILAPLNLPESAVIKNVTFYYYDNNTSGTLGFGGVLYAKAYTSTTDEPLATVSVASTINSHNIQSTTTGSVGHTVNHGSRQYWLRVSWYVNSNTPDDNFRFYGARIEYGSTTVTP